MHYHVTLERRKLCTVVELQGPLQEVAEISGLLAVKFPSTPNTYEKSPDNSQTLYWIGPQRWLLRAELDQEADLKRKLSELELPDAVSAALISDSLSFFKITGVDASAVISIASPMDVHPSVFPANGASYTEAFGLKALVIRCDHELNNGFEVVVERSYGDMLNDYFQRAIGAQHLPQTSF